MLYACMLYDDGRMRKQLLWWWWAFGNHTTGRRVETRELRGESTTAKANRQLTNKIKKQQRISNFQHLFLASLHSFITCEYRSLLEEDMSLPAYRCHHTAYHQCRQRGSSFVSAHTRRLHSAAPEGLPPPPRRPTAAPFQAGYWTPERRRLLKIMTISFPFMVGSGVALYNQSHLYREIQTQR